MTWPVRVPILPIARDVEIARDSDARIELQATDADGAPIDITTDTWRLVVKTGLGGTTQLTLTNTPGGHSDPATGRTIFQFARTDLLGLSTTAPTRWIYEIRRVSGSIETPWFAGAFTIVPTR